MTTDHTCKWKWTEVHTPNRRPSDLSTQSSDHSSRLRVQNIDSLQKKICTRAHAKSYQVEFTFVMSSVFLLSFNIPLP